MRFCVWTQTTPLAALLRLRVIFYEFVLVALALLVRGLFAQERESFQ